MRFSALILAALASLAFAEDPSTDRSASAPSALSSVVVSIPSAITSIVQATTDESTPPATPSTTVKEADASSVAESTGAAATMYAGEAGGVVVAALGAIAWVL